MFKKVIILMFLILFIFAHSIVTIADESIKTNIYNRFFVSAKIVKIPAFSFVDNKIIYSTFTDKEINFLRKEMDKIVYIRKTQENISVVGGYFKSGYYCLEIFESNKNEWLSILYSIDEKNMAIREEDLLSKKRTNNSLENIYQFQFTDAVRDLLINKEKSLCSTNKCILVDRWML